MPQASASTSAPNRLRAARSGWLKPALFLLCVFALILTVSQLGAALAFAEELWPVVLFSCVFLVWVAAGVIAWWRRSDNGIGPLLVVGGIAIFLGGLSNVPAPLYETINAVFATSVLAVAVHVLHAFPSGRVYGRMSITTVCVAYVVAIGFDVFMTVVGPHMPEVAAASAIAQSLLGGMVMVSTALILGKRLSSADQRHRRVLLPLYLYGIVSVLLVPLAPLVVGLTGLDPAVSGVAQLVILVCLPVSFLLGVLLGGFKRTTALDALSRWLAVEGTTRAAAGLALATALGDDSLRVVYWVAEDGRFVDQQGSAVAHANLGQGRGWVDVQVDGRLVGAIEYDTRLLADQDSVRRAGELLAIAIDRERLTTELLASNQQLEQSRLRLLEAAYRERSRIARDLHDGLQVKLVLLALEAQMIANSSDSPRANALAAEQLRRGIDHAAADLRNLVNNVLPAGLLEQGLVAAAEDLIDRLEMPASLDGSVNEAELSNAASHTAFFVLAELLANAVKHSRAKLVRVTLNQADGRLMIEVRDDGVGGAQVEGGTGLTGLMDRIAAHDGSFSIASNPGEGTQVRVELPCA